MKKLEDLEMRKKQVPYFQMKLKEYENETKEIKVGKEDNTQQQTKQRRHTKKRTRRCSISLSHSKIIVFLVC